MEKKMNKKEVERLFGVHFTFLSKKDSGLVGRPISVRIVDEPEHLGYTSAGRCIYINPFHEVMPEDMMKRMRLVDGINCHEVLHQLFTDFKAAESFVRHLEGFESRKWPEVESPKLDQFSLSIYHTIHNIVEDTSIEYWGFRTLGGDMPRALEFTISTLFKESPKISEANNAFSQLISALIQYGDVGLIKGTFTFPEAKECFLKVLPVYDKAIESPSARERLLLAYEIFQMSKPLWETEVEKQKAMMEALEKLMKDLGSEMSSGEGSGEFSEDASEAAGESSSGSGSSAEDSPLSEKKKSERRKKLLKALGEESDDKNGSGSGNDSEKDSEDNAGENSEDGTGSGSEKSDEKSGEEDSGSGSNKDGEEEGSEGKKGESSSANGSSENSENSNSNGSESNDGSTSRDADKKPSGGYGGYGNGEDDDDFFELNEKTELSAEEAEELAKQLDAEIAKFEKDEKIEDDGAGMKLPEFDISGRCFTKASCKNEAISVSATSRLVEQYETVTKKMGTSIRHLANQLLRIKKTQAEEKEARTSGKINLDRLRKVDYERTSRLFDRRTVKNKSDLALFVLVDESGSMYNRAKYARYATIALAEACEKAKIPLYVMGFSADEGAKANHFHYIRWKNNAKSRLALLNISARSNNFDGYSIRYATKILKKRPEEKKLLIVISDGQPACYTYRGDSEGIQDTKEAVRQANKIGIVQGVLIGGADEDVLKEIYGINFTKNDNLETLLTDLGKVVSKRLRR